MKKRYRCRESRQGFGIGNEIMAFRLPLIKQAKKHILFRTLSRGKKVLSANSNIPKGYLAVYVGEEKKKRFVVPISYLHQPAFQ
ncbi:hypothetical protein RYX36_036285 [Vicia faba]